MVIKNALQIEVDSGIKFLTWSLSITAIKSNKCFRALGSVASLFAPVKKLFSGTLSDCDELCADILLFYVVWERWNDFFV